MATIHFDKWTKGTLTKLNRRQRVKCWFMRRSLYQKYIWWRYGKKIIITDWIKF